VSDSKQPAVQALLDLDRVVPEPARLAILTILSSVEEVELEFLETAIGLTKGNLSSHVAKLEGAGYLTVNKAFRDRIPVTSYRITSAGRTALDGYRKRMLEGLERKPWGRTENEPRQDPHDPTSPVLQWFRPSRPAGAHLSVQAGTKANIGGVEAELKEASKP